MRAIRVILAGVIFGIVMIKSEASSWYRIQEMFRFQSFHMYGIIGTAVTLGAISVYLLKKFKVRDTTGRPISFEAKLPGWKQYLFGGIIFGLGWALTGACPGPMFVTIGYGYPIMIVVVLAALAGTFCYGLIRDNLPH